MLEAIVIVSVIMAVAAVVWIIKQGVHGDRVLLATAAPFAYDHGSFGQAVAMTSVYKRETRVFRSGVPDRVSGVQRVHGDNAVAHFGV